MEQYIDYPGLVPTNKVQEYLDEQGIRVSRLDNGLTIVGCNRFIPDSNSADLEIGFPGGSFFDPEGRQGILHVYEHLISNRSGMAAKKSDGYFNAHTRTDEMRIFTKGTANPGVLDYGYWPIVPIVFDELTDPKLPTTERLEIEKKVVLREYSERNGNGNSAKIRDFRLELFYGQDHPQTREVDTVEGVKAITLNDIKELQERVLIAPGIYTEILTQGRPELLDVVFAELENNLSRMPVGRTPPQTFDYELTKPTNSNFKSGELHTLDDGSKDGNINLEFVWKVPTRSFDPHTFALGQLWQEIGGRFFGYVREQGYGYTAGSSSQSTEQKSLDGTRFNIVYLRTDTVSNLSGYADRILGELRQNVISRLTDSELEDLLYRISRPIAAMPLSTAQRLSDAVRGLRFYGRPIDSRTIHDTLLSISKDDLKYWRDKLLDEDPAFIITGDLGKRKII